MQPPADIPAQLNEVLALSERLDGASVMYGPDDKVVYVSPAFRKQYYFCSLDDATWDDIFWASVRAGLYSAEELRTDPESYAKAAKTARRAIEQFDFIKRYKTGDMLGHHRAADGWSVQVRIATDSPLWKGGFSGVEPRSLAEAAGAADATRNLRRALDALSVGMAFIRRDHAVSWANVAAGQCLLGLRGVSLHEDRLVFEDPELEVEYRRTMARVVGAPKETRVFMSLPTLTGPPTVAALLPHRHDEAVLLFGPSLDDDSVTAALRGFGLSPAETRVALLVAQGHKPQVVADMIGKSVNTVRAQLSSIFKKAGDDAPSSRAGVGSLVYRIAAVAGARRRT